METLRHSSHDVLSTHGAGYSLITCHALGINDDTRSRLCSRRVCRLRNRHVSTPAACAQLALAEGCMYNTKNTNSVI